MGGNQYFSLHAYPSIRIAQKMNEFVLIIANYCVFKFSLTISVGFVNNWLVESQFRPTAYPENTSAILGEFISYVMSNLYEAFIGLWIMLLLTMITYCLNLTVLEFWVKFHANLASEWRSARSQNMSGFQFRDYELNI